MHDFAKTNLKFFEGFAIDCLCITFHSKKNSFSAKKFIKKILIEK